jgi:hypothetical protein
MTFLHANPHSFLQRSNAGHDVNLAVHFHYAAGTTTDGAEKAAGPVFLRTSPQHFYSGSMKGCRDRFALKSLVFLVFKKEFDQLAGWKIQNRVLLDAKARHSFSSDFIYLLLYFFPAKCRNNVLMNTFYRGYLQMSAGFRQNYRLLPYPALFGVEYDFSCY